MRHPRVALWVLGLLLAACSPSPGPSPSPTRSGSAAASVQTGRIGASSYRLVVPARWNRTLVLYSHGYQAPGSPVGSAPDVAGNPIGQWLLEHGYALAGSSYSSAGWAIEQALPDQVAVLDRFTTKVGRPDRVIAWGHSLGGMVTAALVQAYPDRFAGALPMCGVLAGGVPSWNLALDSEFALRTLLVPQSSVELVHIRDPAANGAAAAAVVSHAQDSVAGRARLALVAALSDEPGWFDPTLPEPAPTDFVGQQRNQYRWLAQVALPFGFNYRAELEKRAGGNPSSNVGVDYAAELARSRDAAEVAALYAAAGLDLDRDLGLLAAGPRIAADPGAAAYLARYFTFDGRLSVPVLSMHTTDDGLVGVEQESAYSAGVSRAGKDELLRQAFVHRAGHCFFTAGETIAAFQLLVQRLDTGSWPVPPSDLPGYLAAAATALGPSYNTLPIGNRPAPPAFTDYRPGPFLRASD